LDLRAARSPSIALLVLLITAATFAGAPGHDQRIDSASRLLVEQSYGPAFSLLRQVSVERPGDLEALYLQLAVRQTEILDYESYVLDGDCFCRLADSVLVLLRGHQSALHGADSIACLLYIANTVGGKSVMQAKQGNWWAAIGDAYSSISMLKTVQSLDPSCDASYLATGVFNYYLSQNLKWLPLFGDRTK
jgi:hypothetical protein